jgi:CDP-diacylglycerol--glycerol-3-phosphate 3-phosphatidyltransferase
MQTETIHFRATLQGLQLRLAGTALASLALVGAGTLVLSNYWEPGYALRWGGITTAAVLLLLWVFWRYLPENHPPSHTHALFTDFGLPNLLTYWRGFLVACTAGFLFSPRPLDGLQWLPGVLFSLGILPDYFDGYLARVTGRTSQLGEFLDVAVDSLAVFTGTLLVVTWELVPVWYLLVGLARYLFLAGIWIRERLHKPVFPLPTSLSRRALAGTQMGFLMVLLWPLFGPPATVIAAYFFAIPFLLNFTRDWLFVSGVIKPNPEGKPLTLPAAFTRWLPLALRLVVVLGLGEVLLRWSAAFQPLAAALGRLGVQLPVLFLGLLLLLTALVLICTAIGAMGRTMAVLALCLTGIFLQAGAYELLPAVLIALSSALLLFLGSGAFSAWTPEQVLFERRAGDVN